MTGAFCFQKTLKVLHRRLADGEHVESQIEERLVVEQVATVEDKGWGLHRLEDARVIQIRVFRVEAAMRRAGIAVFLITVMPTAMATRTKLTLRANSSPCCCALEAL